MNKPELTVVWHGDPHFQKTLLAAGFHIDYEVLSRNLAQRMWYRFYARHPEMSDDDPNGRWW